MICRAQAGISRIVMVLFGVGSVALIGILLIVLNASNPDEILENTTAEIVEEPSMIVTDIENKGAGFGMGEDDEEAKLIRTVDSSGNTTWMHKEETTIYLPGKGPVKAYKIASETGIKMKPMPVKPEAVKALHPAIKRGKGKHKVKITTKGGDPGEEGGAGSTKGEGGKVGEGAGPGTGGK